MGKKFDLVSYLCGALSCKKTPDNSDDHQKGDSHKLAPDKSSSPASETSEEQRINTSQPPLTDQEELQNRQPIPPPPGRQQQQECFTRATSCHHKHTRSNSAVSKLTSSLSMKVLTAARQSSRRDDGGNRKMKLEESIWKKTIILGEKCKVPEEDDDTILYDERGNRISSYHPKNHSGVLSSLSRQTSIMDEDSVSRKLGANGQDLSRK